MTDARHLNMIKITVDEGLACLLSKTEIAWLVQRVEQLEKEVQRVEQLEKEVQNLRDALASS